MSIRLAQYRRKTEQNKTDGCCWTDTCRGRLIPGHHLQLSYSTATMLQTVRRLPSHSLSSCELSYPSPPSTNPHSVRSSLDTDPATYSANKDLSLGLGARRRAMIRSLGSSLGGFSSRSILTRGICGGLDCKSRSWSSSTLLRCHVCGKSLFRKDDWIFHKDCQFQYLLVRCKWFSCSTCWTFLKGNGKAFPWISLPVYQRGIEGERSKAYTCA